ncbi:hypothetical protein OBBRIDRAFT_807386 [Obba rivulosa]|uniref:Uncharacterized protein n=1 Tax=Obba rivulosa TaxID=1052685 RepID=A0A8E2AK08_9APHY|nr:hypothetical protein OBBRIDRAFT_807386 [Obba rivulosa]
MLSLWHSRLMNLRFMGTVGQVEYTNAYPTTNAWVSPYTPHQCDDSLDGPYHGAWSDVSRNVYPLQANGLGSNQHINQTYHVSAYPAADAWAPPYTLQQHGYSLDDLHRSVWNDMGRNVYPLQAGGLGSHQARVIAYSTANAWVSLYTLQQHGNALDGLYLGMWNDVGRNIYPLQADSLGSYQHNGLAEAPNVYDRPSAMPGSQTTSGCSTELPAPITGHVWSHLQQCHYVTFDLQSVRCLWGTCSKVVLANGLSKHIVKKHFGATRGVCPQCYKLLSRKDTIKRHIERYCQSGGPP